MSGARPARFLGLAAGERNARLIGRTSHDPSALTIPADVIITPALFPVLPADGVWRLEWEAGRAPIIWRARSAAPKSDTVPRVLHLPDGAALDVSTASARRRAAWRLLRASGKPTDGWLSRHIHRKVSRVCSYALLRLGLSANHATFLTFLVGVAAAWFMAQTTHATMIAGALLFWFASIADGIDGEMARLTLTESAYGEQLDTAVDHATHLLGYAGVMFGWWRQGIGPAGWALAVGVALGLPIMQLGTMYLVRRGQGISGQFFVDTKPIEISIAEAARETGAPPLKFAAAAWVLFRREASALGFFLVSLVTGQRAVYPALLAAGLLIVAVIVLAYRTDIERAMPAKKLA